MIRGNFMLKIQLNFMYIVLIYIATKTNGNTALQKEISSVLTDIENELEK